MSKLPRPSTLLPHAPVRPFALMLAAAAIAGCEVPADENAGGGSTGDASSTSASDTDVGTTGMSTGADESTDETGTIPTTGNAGLTFTALLGDSPKGQFDTAAKPFIPEDTSTDRGDLLILLCTADDTGCADPVSRLIDKDGGEEWSGDAGGPAPLQRNFGPTISVADLPAGDWQLMVVYDSLDSQRRGFGWDDDFPTDESAWGGLVSETDLMMADRAPEASDNPPPVALPITLVDNEVLDLGEIILSHYHERKISEPPAADDGVLVVGNKTDNAMRIIDLNAYAVEESAPDRYDYPLVDSGGSEISGTMCNVIEGPGDTVYALFTSTNFDIPQAGFAAQFDVNTRQQVGGIVSFPKGQSEAGPCRAVWHAHEGNDYLFAVAADSTNQGNNRGFWYANVGALGSGDLDATLMALADDLLFDKKLMNVEAWNGEVYIGTNTSELTECEGETCLFIADFDTDGRPTLRTEGNGDRSLYRLDPLDADVSVSELGNQTVSCQDEEQGVYYFGLSVETFKKNGSDYLVVGRCHAVDMVDLAAGSVVDFDDTEPGTQGIVGALFGGGFYDFDLSPDGDTLWAVPANKSRFVHYPAAYEPVGDIGDGRVTIDRHALMPIDLSASADGELPSVVADYGSDRDGFEGMPDDGIQDFATPAFDPGVDLRGAFLKMYYLMWNKSLSGSLPNPFPVGPSIAVANNTVWLRGAGADLGDEGPSGLGDGGNLSVLDLDAQRLVLWPRTPEGDFYRAFVGLKQWEFGFDLTPARETSVATAGIVYMDL